MKLRLMPLRLLRTLLLPLIAALLLSTPGRAQSAEPGVVHGKVVDARGAPLAQSTILDAAGKELATTGADGSFEVPAGTDEIEVSNPHYAPVKVPISKKGPLTVMLERPLETVMVSAYRSPLTSADSPASPSASPSSRLALSPAHNADC